MDICDGTSLNHVLRVVQFSVCLALKKKKKKKKLTPLEPSLYSPALKLRWVEYLCMRMQAEILCKFYMFI